MKGLLRVHFLYSQNHRDIPPKNIFLILIYSKSLSPCMQRLDMSRLYANDFGSHNYSYGRFVVKHRFLLEIALYH